MEKKKQKITIKQKVFLYLKKKRAAVTKSRICHELSLRKASVDYACSALKKEKKVGYQRNFSHTFPGRILKTYWGISPWVK